MGFDIEEFKNTLYSESKTVFLELVDKYNDQNIYSIALYTNGDSWGYIFPTFATVKGLEKVSKKYKKIDYYKDETLEHLKNDLKWSPCDSPLHEEYDEALPKTEILLANAAELMDAYCDSGDEEKCCKLNQELEEACLSVLEELRKNGVFSKINESSFVLNLLAGDQSDEERLRRAKRLNLDVVLNQYAKEI